MHGHSRKYLCCAACQQAKFCITLERSTATQRTHSWESCNWRYGSTMVHSLRSQRAERHKDRAEVAVDKIAELSDPCECQVLGSTCWDADAVWANERTSGECATHRSCVRSLRYTQIGQAALPALRLLRARRGQFSGPIVPRFIRGRGTNRKHYQNSACRLLSLDTDVCGRRSWSGVPARTKEECPVS